VRHFWIPLLFISASLGFTQAQPWDKRTYDQALADPKKTVVDYFLLCPDIWLDSSGNFYVSPNTAAGRGAFEDRKNLLRKGFSTQGVSLDSVVVDLANAYISISGKTDFAFALTFVFFDRQGKSDIPAYSYYSDGVEADSYECRFYELDSANVWTDVTDKLVPALSLSDLENGSQKYHGAYPEVDWVYILPQKGTTVLAFPHLTYHRGNDESPPPPVDNLIQNLLNRKLELLWDNKQGRFTKGALRQ
jgi:hypothetical protein